MLCGVTSGMSPEKSLGRHQPIPTKVNACPVLPCITGKNSQRVAAADRIVSAFSIQPASAVVNGATLIEIPLAPPSPSPPTKEFRIETERLHEKRAKTAATNGSATAMCIQQFLFNRCNRNCPKQHRRQATIR